MNSKQKIGAIAAAVVLVGGGATAVVTYNNANQSAQATEKAKPLTEAQKRAEAIKDVKKVVKDKEDKSKDEDKDIKTAQSAIKDMAKQDAPVATYLTDVLATVQNPTEANLTAVNNAYHAIDGQSELKNSLQTDFATPLNTVVAAAVHKSVQQVASDTAYQTPAQKAAKAKAIQAAEKSQAAQKAAPASQAPSQNQAPAQTQSGQTQQGGTAQSQAQAPSQGYTTPQQQAPAQQAPAQQAPTPAPATGNQQAQSAAQGAPVYGNGQTHVDPNKVPAGHVAPLVGGMNF